MLGGLYADFRAPLDVRRDIAAHLTSEHGSGGFELLNRACAKLSAEQGEQALREWVHLSDLQKEQFISGNEEGTVIVPPGCRGLQALSEALDASM